MNYYTISVDTMTNGGYPMGAVILGKPMTLKLQ